MYIADSIMTTVSVASGLSHGTLLTFFGCGQGEGGGGVPGCHPYLLHTALQLRLGNLKAKRTHTVAVIISWVRVVPQS